MSFRPARDATKPNVAGGGVNRLTLARRRPIAQAVVGRTQMGSAFHHPTNGRTVAFDRHATGFLDGFGARRREEASGPLPHVADHVMESIAVGGKSIDGRGAFVSVELEVLP